MNPSLKQQPLIRQGWLRVLLFCISYFILQVAAVLLSLLFLKQVNKESAQNLDGLLNGKFLWLAIVVNLLIALLVISCFLKWIDKKPWSSLGFGTAGYFKQASAGLLLSFSMLGTGALLMYFSHHLRWDDIQFSVNDLFIAFGMTLLIAIYEESVFRGYILGNLMVSFNKWTSVLISAALFTIFHLANPGAGFVPLLNIFLAGVLLGTNYVYTRNLWFSILFHLGWNFFQGAILGFKVSGLKLGSLLQMTLKGDLLLTGGEFGFEGSVFDSMISVIVIVLLLWIYERKFSPGGIRKSTSQVVI